MANKLYIDAESLAAIIDKQGEGFDLKIQQAVIDNVLKRQSKAIVPGDTQKIMGDLIKREVKRAVREEVATVVENWSSTKVTLLDKVIAKIHNTIRDSVNEAIAEGMTSSRTIAEEAVQRRLDRIDELVGKVMEEEVRRLVRPILVENMRTAMSDVFVEAIGGK